MNVLKLTWPPAVIALIIFYLCCLIPSDDIPTFEWNFFFEKDKVVHFLMYFGLALVASCNYIYLRKGRIIILKYIGLTLLVPILYGGLIEVIQAEYFVDRSGDWYDFVADILGVLASVPISLCYRRFLLNRQLRNEI